MGTDVSTISRDANEILRGQIFGSQGPTVRGGTRLTPEQTQAILRGEPVGRVIRIRRGGGSSRLTPAQHARQLDLAKSAELQKEQARRELASKLETKQQREITQRSEAIAFQRRQERLPEQITRTELPAHTIDKTTIQREQPPYLEERKVGTFRVNGKEVVETKVFLIDPKTGEERQATAEEQKYFQTQTSVLVASEGKAPSKVSQA